MERSETILVVDDDREILDLIKDYLAGEGYQVAAAVNEHSARDLLRQQVFDLAVVDLGLPDGSGLALTRDIRATSSTAVIIPTGRGDPIDRVVGLEIGADDYMAKPVLLRELLARIRSVLRRAQPSRTQAARSEGEMLTFAEWTLDTVAWRLTSADGREFTLTTAEFNLLQVFLTHANRVLSRDQLLDLARGREAGPLDRSIDVLVGRLRRKIEQHPRAPTLIKTVHGGGYIFTARVKSRP
jgi:two-component system OmpR family response regulator